MSKAYDFKLALTRVIVPTAGPVAKLLTIVDAARHIPRHRRQAGRSAHHL
jgi:hypothetical protein